MINKQTNKVKFFPNKFGMLTLILSIFLGGIVKAQDTSLKVHYLFNYKTGTDSILDETGNGYNASTEGSASIIKLGNYDILETGNNAGYLDLGAKTGQVIKTLNDFTVSTYLYIDPSLSLSNAGNFIWTFSNSADINTTATGCMFFSAIQTRYAICPTYWKTEQEVSPNMQTTKGQWVHITYTQSGTTGSVYVNGVLLQTGTITMLPSTLGATAYNYLAKSAYASDQYLMNSMYYDFRIYNKALTSNEVTGLNTYTASLDTVTYQSQVDSAIATLSLGDLSAVASDITLPGSTSNGATISWTSSNTAIISNTGIVTRPAYGSDTASVKLTATVSRSFVSDTISFIAHVIPSYNDQECVKLDSDSLALNDNIYDLHSNIALPVSGAQGSTISWSSDNSSVLSNTGQIVNRPAHGSGNVVVTLTATITKGTASTQKVFKVTVAQDEGYTGYLFVYFTGNTGDQEAIRFAISTDGLNYKALNNDNPVISSAAISESGGVRDPNIIRGHDGKTFYMVATDMVSANGWNSNRGLVMLKSTNLTDWTSTAINIPNTYSEYANVDRVWAPETVYDPTVGKYMVYFSMLRNTTGDYDKIYYAYANSDFTGFESAPKVLFDNGKSTIDPDIAYKDSLYQLFFKTEGNGNGIKKAVSKSVSGGYVLFDKYLQATTNPVEGECVFRLINSDTWMMIYDEYTSGAYQFTESTNLVNFAVVPNVSYNFTPRHGTIIPITAAEMDALNAKWGPSAAVKTVESTQAVKIYPVPTNNILHIDFNNSNNKDIKATIYNMLGSAVMVKNFNQNNNQINVSGLTKGIYFIRLTNGDSAIESQRFIIQ